jgi:hypothetical protein
VWGVNFVVVDVEMESYRDYDYDLHGYSTAAATARNSGARVNGGQQP